MIIRNLFYIAIGLLPVASHAASLHIDVTNNKNDTGVVKVMVFSEANKDAFPHTSKPNLCVINAKINQGIATAICPNLSIGKYAISVIHDENNNGKFDRNWLGIPKEGYGFSNDVMGSFGPPDFDRAVIEITDVDFQLSITMQYH